jgi:putative spermidine/putrescine transport system substrate-binding protein
MINRKKNIILLSLIFAGIIMLTACKQNQSTTQQDSLMTQSWEEIEQKARGTTVVFMKYLGDKRANKHIDEYVVPTVLKRYGIMLKIIPGQGNEIVNSIMTEQEAGLAEGQTDMVWINGETFYQLQQIKGLYGPFTDKLPNSKYINYEDPIIKYDFQQAINGYEAPWGKASFIGITDATRVKSIPQSMQDFEAYWKAHPGKFTIPLDFSGYTLLKSWLVEIAGGIKELDGDFNQEKYDKYAPKLWDFINRNKKYFWKNGTTFPASNVTVSQMFGSGELDFAFSFGITAIDKGIKEGLFPATSKAFVFKAGSIHNTSYLGIPYNAPNKEGALVVINFLLSPEAQIEKSDINNSGGMPVFDYQKLEKQWQDKYQALPKIKYGMSEEAIQQRAIKETHSQYMINVAADFRTQVIERP